MTRKKDSDQDPEMFDDHSWRDTLKHIRDDMAGSAPFDHCDPGPAKVGATTNWTSVSAGSSSHKCYKSHPAFDIGGGLMIYGGNCGTPSVTDADIYIGFQSGMAVTGRRFPWREGHEIQFVIQDRHAPVDVKEFDHMVNWTIAQLQKGKKVHAGCIGGHGRTGLFLAALRARHAGDPDPIKTVRLLYCSKAVESAEQVKFLMTHYGAAHQEHRPYTAYSAAKPSSAYTPNKGDPSKKVPKGSTVTTTTSGSPIHRDSSIWAIPKLYS